MDLKNIFKKIVEAEVVIGVTSTTADAPLPTVGADISNPLDGKVTAEDLLELISDLKVVFEPEEDEEDDCTDTYALMFLDILERMVKFKNIDDAVANQLYFDLASMLDIADDEEIDADENEIEEIDIGEAVPVPKKINPAIHNARKLAYKKNKARIKIKAARFRKTASFKKYLKRKNQMKKVGKTSTGKRHARFF